MKDLVLKIAAIALALFAAVTIFMSGSVLFDLFGIRAKEGNYVLFVVVANFICGFLYLMAAIGLFLQRKWSNPLLITTLGILLVAFLGFMWHIEAGGLYEMRTVKALGFRFLVTLLFAGISWFYLTRNKKSAKKTAG